jgi:hypothetical protein
MPNSESTKTVSYFPEDIPPISSLAELAILGEMPSRSLPPAELIAAIAAI